MKKLVLHQQPILDMLRRLSDRHLLALHRVAKHPTRGVRPIFGHPRAMILLRSELEYRDLVPPDPRRSITQGVTRKGKVQDG